MKKLFIIFALLAWLPLAYANEAALLRADKALKAGDSKRALSILTPLAEKGDVAIQFFLGVMYEHGQGVPTDYNESFKWLSKSAKQGFAESQYYLGAKYNKGRGVSKNHEEALKWHRKAAKQGHQKSQINLASMYSVGLGTPENLVRSYMWARIAANNGYSKGNQLVKILKKDMTSSNVRKAQNLATQCWKSNYQNCGE